MSLSSAYSQRPSYGGDDSSSNKSSGNSSQSGAAMPSSDDQQPRGSSSSGRSSMGRSSRQPQNPQQQLSTIEKSVTHLLVATKQLLETLTMWSRGTANEGEVSDVYVRLGYEFNIACRAFSAIGVDTSDLGPVPDLLRNILEDTLSQEASQASLDKYLPRIRDIIINLLHGLKKKQQRLRQKTGSGRENAEGRQTRQASLASANSAETSLTQQLDNMPSRETSGRSFAQRQGSGELGGPDLPPRTTSVAGSGGRGSPRRQNLSPQTSLHQPGMQQADSGSSISSNTLQNIPVIAPYPEENTMPVNNQPYDTPAQSYNQDALSPDTARPKPNDALTALQKSGDLERRASRRFSSYQISKHLGPTMNGIAAIPPAQHSPVPNRGRDVRESMNAVRSRGNTVNSRPKSRTEKARSGTEGSHNVAAEAGRILEEQQDEDLAPPMKPYATEENNLDSPMQKTPEDKLGNYFPEQRDPGKMSATLSGPLPESFVPDETTPITGEPEKKVTSFAEAPREAPSTPPPAQFIPDGSPQSGKELTLFLQYKSKIKKFVFPDGGSLTVPKLQLAFIEKFAWNTHNNGVDLPEIYVQDPVSGVRHELEDLSDIKERSVLVLNVEALDEVKRHIDDGIGGLRRIVEEIRTSVDGQQSALQRVSDRQHETAKDIAGLTAAPLAAGATAGSVTSPTPVASKGISLSPKDKAGQLSEVQTLRRDLAVIRQVYTSFASDMQASMTSVRTKAASVKKAAANASIPDMDENTGRAYVNKGKKSLGDDSEKIVNRVDDLQDLVEDLRKDVVVRGVRPLPRQLDTVSKDISIATADLKKMQEYLRKEKPIWSKIWEKELQVVCDDRDLLTMQEELATDLEDDLEKAAATFALVEQATKQQNLANPPGNDSTTGLRSTSRNLVPLAIDTNADPHKVKDSVLGEVRALQPNHESRLEAIERAEKSRQLELESRKGGEFQRELGNFVEEGKLKKSGGIEEVERVRKQREEASRKEVYERTQARLAAQAEKKAAQAAALAQQQQEQAQQPAEQATETTQRVEGEQQTESAPVEEPAATERESAEHSQTAEQATAERVFAEPVVESTPSEQPEHSTDAGPEQTQEHTPPTQESTKESSPEPDFVEANEQATASTPTSSNEHSSSAAP